MQTAIFILRAQPLHKGHVHAIKQLRKKYKVVVALGSTNRKDSKNPFSCITRRKMLRSVFRNIRIIGIEDSADDDEWIRSVKKKAKFDVVVSGNPWVRRCFSDYETAKPELFGPDKYDASEIRKLMRNGKRWEHLVPVSVAKIIIEIRKKQ